MADTLYSDSGTAVLPLTLTADMLLDKSIVLYGASRSGKTVFTKYIMDLMREHVSQAILVSPSEPANNAYVDYMPRALTHYAMKAPDPKNPRKTLEGEAGAIQFLKNIWSRQEMLVQTYEQANRIAVLRGLAARLSAREAAKMQDTLAPANKKRASTLAQLEKRYRGRPGELKEQRRKVNELFEQVERSVYKAHMWANFAHLWGLKDLSAGERAALQYIDLNPRMVLVLDDCGADLKAIMGKPIFRSLFYRNRHVRLTVIFTFQDDTDLLTNLRKNAFISIFCDRVSAESLFTRGSNNFSADAKKRVKDIAEVVFDGEYRKLVYIRDDPRRENFYHGTALPPKGHMFPCGAVLEYCHMVERSAGTADTSNPYFSSFAVR